MNQKHIFVLLHILFTVLFISGCSQGTGQHPRAMPQLTTTTIQPTTILKIATPTNTILPTLSATPTPDTTPTIAASPTLAGIPTKMPDILINLGTNDWFWKLCFPKEGNATIWSAEYPFSDFQILLADSGVDYLYPRWSPSGNQFAYVQSIPISIPEGAEIPTTVDEGVSVWVQDLSGNRRRVSTILPRINFVQADSCNPATYISSPPQWSPDEKKIVFTYVDLFKFEIDYYLSDLETDTTYLFHKDKMGKGGLSEDLVWINPNQLALLSGKNTLLIFDSNGKLSQQIDLPENLLTVTPNPIIYAIRSFKDKLFVGFAEKERANNKPVSWYVFNTTVDTWQQVLDVSNMKIGYPYTIDSQTISCDTDVLTIFDEQWQVVGRNNALPAAPDDCFNSFHLFKYNHQIFASYSGSTDDNQKDGIWVMVIQKRDPQPELLVDLSNLPEPIRWQYSIVIDYSWHTIMP